MSRGKTGFGVEVASVAAGVAAVACRSRRNANAAAIRYFFPSSDGPAPRTLAGESHRDFIVATAFPARATGA